MSNVRCEHGSEIRALRRVSPVRGCFSLYLESMALQAATAPVSAGERRSSRGYVLSSLLHKCHRPDRACRAPPNLEWKANEPEPTLSNELVEIAEAFHVCNPAFSAREMGLEVRLALGRRADRFDPKRDDFSVRKPVHGVDVEPWEIVQVTGRTKQPVVDPHMDQNCIAMPDLLA